MAVVSIPTSVAGVSLPGLLGSIAKGPLSVLFEGKELQSLRYPSDLGTDPSKFHYVQFLVKEIIPAGYSTSDKSPIAAGSKGTSVNVSGIADTVKAAADMFGAGGGVTDFINNYAPEKSIAVTPSTTRPRLAVSLYMPDTLTAEYNSDYSEMNIADTALGTLQTISSLAGTASQVAGAFNAKDGTIGDKISAGKDVLMNFASTDPLALKLLTNSNLGYGLTPQLGDILLKAKGFAINPQVQMVYKGIGLRSFSLSFTLTPKSADESVQIAKIIQAFKYHFAPGLQAGSSSSTNSMFLTPPSLFNIAFMINGKENQYLPKYGDCALMDISVNYAPNGFAAHERTGAPVQTTLTLSFKETQILDKQKIANGDLR